MTLPALLALLTVFVGVPLNVYVTWRLWRLHRAHPALRALRERGIVETGVLIVVAVFGITFLNNDLPEPFLTGDATKLITRAAMLVLAVGPAVFWLRLYRGVKP